MTFDEVLAQTLALLDQEGRVSYRALKRRFDLDDDYVQDLKAEIIDAKQVAIDEDGKVLVSIPGPDGGGAQSARSTPRSPISYTPPHLAESIMAERSAMEARAVDEGERKTITALFSDLKGSTALIDGLDPEEARNIIDPALQIMMDAVHRYDGYVSQALGDGIFALFGAPIAREDHPQRALYAALRMQDEIRRHSDEQRLKGGVPLSMRVGINTGEVVVRSIRKDDLHTDYVPVGHSTNLAARMQEMATPGSILVTEQTRKLTEGFFDLKPLGKAAVKGADDPIDVYEVKGAGPLRTKLQIAERRGLTRFVGRRSELEQMRQAFAQAEAGHGQVVGVMGEAGLGKSRLFHEFRLTAQENCLVLETYSVPHGTNSPYLPVVELLKSYFQIKLEDDEKTRREKTIGKVLALDRNLEDALPYLFSILGISHPTTSLDQMDPQIRRQRSFDALKNLILRESLNQPAMVIFEDLHWIDGETQGFLDTLSESIASARVALFVTYRPEYRHDWGSKTYYTQLRLTPLGRQEAEDLLIFLMGDDTSLKELKARIIEHTDGTPFFIEEAVRTLVEEGVLRGERGRYRVERTPTELHISPTVQGVLAARIDRLEPDEKTLLQELAVIGRSFPLELVRKVVNRSEDELYRLLSSLQSKEYLYEQPTLNEVEYVFKHALTQEVAYGTVLQEQRKALHEITARAVEGLRWANLENYYGELAYHYTKGDNTEKAVEYLGLAGQQALQRSANVEAISHFKTALDLLQRLPASAERDQEELTLQVALGVPLIATTSWSAPEVRKVYSRAQKLCEQVGDTPRLIPTLFGLWGIYVLRAEHRAARGATMQLLSLAHGVEDAGLHLEAHRATVNTLFWLGEFESAREHGEAGMALYDPQQHRAHVALYPQDPGVGCLAYTAWTLWCLGYPDKALESSQRAITLAREPVHPYSLAWALSFAAFVQQRRRKWEAVRELAAEAIALAKEHGFPLWLAWGAVIEGGALVAQGRSVEALDQIRQGLATYTAIESDVGRSYMLAQLAEVQRTAGQAEEALATVSEALGFVDRTEERCYEAELYRLKGELTLQQHAAGPSSIDEAEACFQKGLDVARRQHARSWELRTATSLARLWQQQNKQGEARELLSGVYGWFTEGFDTKDLQRAKTFLRELE